MDFDQDIKRVQGEITEIENRLQNFIKRSKSYPFEFAVSVVEKLSKDIQNARVKLKEKELIVATMMAYQEQRKVIDSRNEIIEEFEREGGVLPANYIITGMIDELLAYVWRSDGKYSIFKGRVVPSIYRVNQHSKQWLSDIRCQEIEPPHVSEQRHWLEEYIEEMTSWSIVPYESLYE